MNAPRTETHKEILADIERISMGWADEIQALRAENAKLREALQAAIPRLLELDQALNPELWAADGTPLALDNSAAHVIEQARAALGKE